MTTRSGLSLAQAPPLSVPMRFFFTAPLFGILSALILMGSGPDALMTRWAPATLAATHLMTLGYSSLVMVGAMSQMLPVLIGAPMPWPVANASIIHVLLTAGTLLLAGGLLLGNEAMLQAAMPCLGLGFLLFIAIASYCLMHARARNATVSGMWLAIISLTMTVLLGLRVAAEHVWYFTPPLEKSWTDVHLAWGLTGWMSILIIGVAYEVVPMFQMTPRYPQWMQKWLSKFLVSGLFLWTCTFLLPIGDSATKEILADILSSLLAIGLALFAGTTLYLQWRRRRRQRDITLRFWHLAMYNLLTGSLLWVASRLWGALADWDQFGYLLGSLFIGGFVVSVINGMFYKIVPFLVWLHLQSRNSARATLPNMKEIIRDRWAGRQFYLHGLSLFMLLCSVLWPTWFLYPLGALFIFSSLLLFLNIYSALRVYGNVRKHMENHGQTRQ